MALKLFKTTTALSKSARPIDHSVMNFVVGVSQISSSSTSSRKEILMAVIKCIKLFLRNRKHVPCFYRVIET